MAAGFILVAALERHDLAHGLRPHPGRRRLRRRRPAHARLLLRSFGTPIVVNFLSGTVSTIVMVLAFQLSGGNDEKYFNAVLNVVLLFTTMSYILIFPTLIKLRYSHPDVPRPYKVPFGMVGRLDLRDPDDVLGAARHGRRPVPGARRRRPAQRRRAARGLLARHVRARRLHPDHHHPAHRRPVLRGRRKTREQVADSAIETPEGETAPGVVIA